MHYMTDMGATHAVLDVRTAEYTDKVADVTCDVCRQQLRDRGEAGSVDAQFFWFVAVVAIIIGTLASALLVADGSRWTSLDDGCWLHEVHERHLAAPDHRHVTVLCPKEQ